MKAVKRARWDELNIKTKTGSNKGALNVFNCPHRVESFYNLHLLQHVSFLTFTTCIPAFRALFKSHKYVGKVKSSLPSLQPTWNSGQAAVEWNLDRSWCHLHTSEKLSWSQPLDPWREPQYTRILQQMPIQKMLIVLVVWWWHQLLSDSLPNGTLSRVSRRLGRELFTLPS